MPVIATLIVFFFVTIPIYIVFRDLHHKSNDPEWDVVDAKFPILSAWFALMGIMMLTLYFNLETPKGGAAKGFIFSLFPSLSLGHLVVVLLGSIVLFSLSGVFVDEDVDAEPEVLYYYIAVGVVFFLHIGLFLYPLLKAENKFTPIFLNSKLKMTLFFSSFLISMLFAAKFQYKRVIVTDFSSLIRKKKLSITGSFLIVFFLIVSVFLKLKFIDITILDEISRVPWWGTAIYIIVIGFGVSVWVFTIGAPFAYVSAIASIPFALCSIYCFLFHYLYFGTFHFSELKTIIDIAEVFQIEAPLLEWIGLFAIILNGIIEFVEIIQD